MKKITSLLLVASLLINSISGCSDASEEEVQTTVTSENAIEGQEQNKGPWLAVLLVGLASTGTGAVVYKIGEARTQRELRQLEKECTDGGKIWEETTVDEVLEGNIEISENSETKYRKNERVYICRA